MRFALSEEQEQLRDLARRFLDETSGSEAVRAAMATETGFDPALWRRVSDELGWTALSVPEVYGGFGMPFVDQVPILEQLGRHLTCLPYLSSAILGTQALVLGGSEAQKQRWLPGLASGEVRASVSWKGSDGRWDLNGTGVGADPVPGGFQLSGTAPYVLDGHTADVVLVTAGLEDVEVFCVPTDLPGVSRQVQPTMDQTRRLARLDFDRAFLPDDAIMPGGRDAFLKARSHGMIAQACEAVGVAEAAMDLAVDYAKVRRQFSRAIGSFQAVKHMCADMLVAVESARSAAWYGAWALSEDHADLAWALPAAHATALQAAFRCAADCLQVHGGIGFTWESDVHLYLKRARAMQHSFEPPRVSLDRVGRRLLEH